MIDPRQSTAPVPSLSRAAVRRFAIITATWHGDVTDSLHDGARRTLLQAGVPEQNIIDIHVPGTVELVNAAAMVMRRDATLDGIIVLGCVVRGETPHFDYVCQSVTQGITMLNARGETPVIFGVVTTNTKEQALERAGGRVGNKGTEGACTAIIMAQIHHA